MGGNLEKCRGEIRSYRIGQYYTYYKDIGRQNQQNKKHKFNFVEIKTFITFAL